MSEAGGLAGLPAHSLHTVLRGHLGTLLLESLLLPRRQSAKGTLAHVEELAEGLVCEAQLAVRGVHRRRHGC